MSMHGIGADYARTFARQTYDSGVPARPTCLTAAQVAAFLPCFTGKVPAGMTAQQVATLCAAAKTSGVFSLPYCPDAPRGKIPDCLDAGWLDTLSYCERYPNYGGPKPVLNALCWGAKKDAAWYSTVKARPACGAAAPPLDEHGNPPGWVDPHAQPPAHDYTLDEQTLPPVDTAPPAEEHKPNYAMWGGLLALLVVGGGGAYWYVKKHR